SASDMARWAHVAVLPSPGAALVTMTVGRSSSASATSRFDRTTRKTSSRSVTGSSRRGTVVTRADLRMLDEPDNRRARLWLAPHDRGRVEPEHRHRTEDGQLETVFGVGGRLDGDVEVLQEED